MSLVTLEVGPSWKLEVLRGVLEERGLLALVADSNVAPSVKAPEASLQVVDGALDAARQILREARATGFPPSSM
jgi:hypothetical protein